MTEAQGKGDVNWNFMRYGLCNVGFRIWSRFAGSVISVKQINWLYHTDGAVHFWAGLELNERRHVVNELTVRSH